MTKLMSAYKACSIAEGFCDFEPTAQDYMDAWSFLISTGLCRTLQGWYGREASRMIEEGMFNPDGTPTEDLINKTEQFMEDQS